MRGFFVYGNDIPNFLIMPLTHEQLESVLSPGAEALGVELVAVELTGSTSPILRVYIDSDSGVNVDDCAAASRHFSAILDVSDPIESRYTLEVSSPGLDRPLARSEHFIAVIGEKVKIRMHHSISGRKRFTGVLLAADESSVSLDVDGETVSLMIAQMDRARLVPSYNFEQLETS